MIHAALWIISTLFVIWFSVVCFSWLVVFFVYAWRWILGIIILIAFLIFVRTEPKKSDTTEPPVIASPPTMEITKRNYGELRSTQDTDSYTALSARIKTELHNSLSDKAAPEPTFPSIEEKISWLTEFSLRLSKQMPDRALRIDFLKTEYYEAKRAALDPQLVLALIDQLSGFQKDKVSPSDAMGYMQVPHSWERKIGATGNNLLNPRINLRYGCTILRHFLDIEKGDLFRTLIRYRHESEGIASNEITEKDAAFANDVRAKWDSTWTVLPVIHPPLSINSAPNETLPTGMSPPSGETQPPSLSPTTSLAKPIGSCIENRDCPGDLVCMNRICGDDGFEEKSRGKGKSCYDSFECQDRLSCADNKCD